MKIKDKKLLWESIELFTTSNALTIILGTFIGLLAIIVTIVLSFYPGNLDILLKSIGLCSLSYLTVIIILIYVKYCRKITAKKQDSEKFNETMDTIIEINEELNKRPPFF